METIIIRGDSEENTELLLRLARQLNFKARKLTTNEVEEMGISYSIQEGLQSGFLNEAEKQKFIGKLNTE